MSPVPSQRPAIGAKSKVTEKHSPIFIKALKCLALLCLALCVSASAFAKDDAAINHAPAKGAATCEKLLDQKPYDKIIKRMAAIKMELSKNKLLHKGKQSQRKAEDIGLRAAYDVLDKQLQEQLSKDQHKAALIEVEALVSKVAANLEVTENKKQKTLAELKHEREALIKNIETYESHKTQLGKRFSFVEAKFDGPWEWADAPRVAMDYKKDSIALWDKETLLHPNGKNFFSGSSTEVKESMRYRNWHTVIDNNGDIVAFCAKTEGHISTRALTINNAKSASISHMAHIADAKILVADDLDKNRFVIVDFDAAKVTLLPLSMKTRTALDINHFRIYSKKTTTNAISEMFNKILDDTQEAPRSFFTGRKLISIYPKSKSAFVVDLKSRQAHYIKGFKNKFDRLVSVDNSGNIYGVSLNKGQNILSVFKFSTSYKTPNRAVSKTTLKIEPSALNSGNIFVDAAVDASGSYIVTAERPPFYSDDFTHKIDEINRGAAGFYIYDIKGGAPLSSTLSAVQWPKKVIHFGQNQWLFLTTEYKDAPYPHYAHSAKIDFNELMSSTPLEEIKTITHQIEEAKTKLQDIELELKELGPQG